MKAIILRRKGVGEKLEGTKSHEGQVAKDGMEELCGAEVIRSDNKIPLADLCIRWGTTASVPGDPKVINSAKAIHRVYDKRGFRLEMNQHGLCPKTWGGLHEYLLERPQGLAEKLLVRPAKHSRSQGMHVCTDLSELVKAMQEIDGDYYISELVSKKREFRVFCAQNRVAWVIEKLPKNKDDVSWGCVEQGDFKYVSWTDWPLEVLSVALRATGLSGLHFGAVDVIMDSDGHSYVLEINTAPHLSPYYMKTIAKVFKSMIAGETDISLGDYDPKDWKSMIHPAVKDF